MWTDDDAVMYVAGYFASAAAHHPDQSVAAAWHDAVESLTVLGGAWPAEWGGPPPRPVVQLAGPLDPASPARQ